MKNILCNIVIPRIDRGIQKNMANILDPAVKPRDDGAAWLNAHKVNFILIFIVFFLTGCGFHLRQPISAHANLPAIQIISQLKNPQQLLIVKKHLLQTGFSISESSAPIILQLTSMKLETRPYSYTALAKVAEYQLIQTLNYQLFNDHHQPISPIIEIYADRIYPIDQQNLSGNNQENLLIQQELKNNVLKELAEQLNQTLKYINQSKQGS